MINPDSKDFEILKVIDIPQQSVSAAFIQEIEFRHTYADQILKEHIYNINDLIEDIESPSLELMSIKDLCDNNDCGYFRILFI